MNRKCKTGKNNRNNYIYYPSIEGESKTIITKDDCDETVIKFLHEADDKEFDLNRRDEDRGNLYIEVNATDDIDISIYFNSNNKSTNPEDLLIQNEKQKETTRKLNKALTTLLPQQYELVKKKFFENRTNVDIAKEEGVTEAAIRNRLTKILKKLRKNF